MGRKVVASVLTLAFAALWLVHVTQLHTASLSDAPKALRPQLPPPYRSTATNESLGDLEEELRGDPPVAPSEVHWLVPAPTEVPYPKRTSFTYPIWQHIQNDLYQRQPTTTTNSNSPRCLNLTVECPYPQAYTHVRSSGETDRKTELWTLDEALERQFPRYYDSETAAKRAFNKGKNAHCGYTLEAHVRGGEGMFSTLSQLAGAMSVAWRLNRTFIPRGPWVYYAPRHYCYKNRQPMPPHEYSWFNCLFEPITNCDPMSIKFQKGKRDFLEKNVRNIYQHVDAFNGFIRDHYENPPLTKAHLMHNANVLAFLFRPIEPIRQHAAKLKSWLGLASNAKFGTIHIRRTDKNETDVLLRTPDYVSRVVTELQLRQRKYEKSRSEVQLKAGDFHTVFVMTDSDSVIEELLNYTRANRTLAPYRFVWSPQHRSTIGHHWDLKRGAASLSPIQHAVEFLADVLVALDSAVFVGTCGSHVGRNVMALLVAHTLEFDRAVMMDEEMCQYQALRWFNFNVGNLAVLNVERIADLSKRLSSKNSKMTMKALEEAVVLESRVALGRYLAKTWNVSYQKLMAKHYI